jgi:capsular exopolysaccharide synthesis family protein
MQQGSEALNLERALSVLRRRVPLIVLCVVVVAAAAYGFSKHETKKYTAAASLAFSSDSLNQQIAGLQSTGGNAVAQQVDNVELVKLGNTAAKTAAVLGRGLTPQKVASSISVSGQGESAVVAVEATAVSPDLAAVIANTYSREFVQEQQSINRQSLHSALDLVTKQLATLPKAQRYGVVGLNLQQRSQTLRLLIGLRYGNVQVAQEAVPPSAPSSPKTSRNVALGVVLGLLIGLGLAFVLERLDRRIRGPEDLGEIYDLPMLGVVHESAALSSSSRRKGGGVPYLPPAEAEAFNLIRAHLRFFNVDHDLRTIVVASASPEDGKTTVALHLAESAASMGSRVLLLEADLRRPSLGQWFGLHGRLGLTDVLIGSTSLEHATESIELPVPGNASGRRTLDLLTAGAMSPPNPGELIESQAMWVLLEQARRIYDLIVIDTPPLTAVSDAFPLLSKVDGVVLVGRIGHSRRDAAEQLHRVLASREAPVLGVVANGSRLTVAGSYIDPRRETTVARSDTTTSSVMSPNGAAASEEATRTPSGA